MSLLVRVTKTRRERFRARGVRETGRDAPSGYLRFRDVSSLGDRNDGERPSWRIRRTTGTRSTEEPRRI